MVPFDVCQTIPIDLYSNNRNIITTEEQQNIAPKVKRTKNIIWMRWLIWIHSNHNAHWIFTPSATVTKYIYWHVSHLYESFVKRNEKFSFHRFVFLVSFFSLSLFLLHFHFICIAFFALLSVFTRSFLHTNHEGKLFELSAKKNKNQKSAKKKRREKKISSSKKAKATHTHTQNCSTRLA